MKAIYVILILLVSTVAADDVERIHATSVTPKHWSGLPIWGEKAAERGYRLPLPIGITLLYNDQTVPYKSKNDFHIVAHGGIIGGSGGQSVTVPKEDVSIDGRDQSMQVRVDVWIFPFLNLYGIVGYTDGYKDVNARTKNISIPGKPGLEAALRQAGNLPVPIDYEAVNVGFGAVAAGQVDPFGWHPFIMTLVGAYTVARTTTTSNNIYTKIGAFKLGQRYDVAGGKLACLLGVTYQHIDQKVTGTYNFTGSSLEPLMKSVDYEVNIVSGETMNMAGTLMYDFGENDQWNVMVEYGFLNWQQTTLSLGRRF